MDLDPQLLNLLHEWQERRSAGTPVEVAVVCRDQPQLAAPLARLIAAIDRVDTLFAAGGGVGLPLIPGFRLLAEVGRGGMGVVYRAIDTTLDREVAVKVPLVAVVDRRAIERFVREGRALARLLHPHIVSVYAAGVVAGTPYLVMRYVPGGSLAARVHELPARPRRVAALISRVARAVDHAHSLGITHRDLKPSNILLDHSDHPLVSDFGVAALVAGEAVASGSADTPPDAAALTRTGVAVGTPAYAAPEVAAGGPARVAPAVDIWSLGVILSECLTGRPPTRGVGVTLSTTVPSGLARIVRRCLATNPADRYPTATALADALEGWVRRRRAVRWATAFAVWGVASALAVAVLLLVTSPENRHAATSAALQRELAGGEVSLVGESGWPRTHRVRSNREFASTGLTSDRVFYATCPRTCLVELLPTLPADRFSLTAELCHASGLLDTAVGVYAGHARLGGEDVEHRFVALTFSDQGTSKTAYTGPNGVAGGALALHAVALPRGDPPEGGARRMGMGRGVYPPTQAADGLVWRRVELQINPESVSGSLDGAILGGPGGPPVRLLPARMASVAEDLSSAAYPRGGVGLYVQSGKVLARNVRVVIRPVP